MTHAEFSQLNLTDTYRFTFYHGEERYGILINPIGEGNYLIVKKSRIKEYNAEPSRRTEIGEKVNIANIVHWEAMSNNHTIPDAKEHTSKNAMANKLVILGAGASFDTTIEDQHRPPLTCNLFQDESRKFSINTRVLPI